MEFESPDVEKDFPGLYASESGKKSNESDFSDEAHERVSKKDLLIGKRKDKKDTKKDLRYATLEGESSPEEDTDVKSPSKVKKSKPFKFPTTKKEKREKSREKDGKEKETDKDKDKKKDSDKDKEKKKEGKVKIKLKEKKKLKHGEESVEIAEEQPIFGVPLSVATERNKCHDGVDIPLIVRECIDHIQEAGLNHEGLYKVSGKSKAQSLRRLYNQREPVNLTEYDLPVTTSLLKLFLRELPEPVMTTELLPKFEEAAAVKDVSVRAVELRALVDKLPQCNCQLLGWLIRHFEAVVAHEKTNKMNAQSLATTMSSVLQASQKLISALLCHCDSLFPDCKLTKYIPPLSCGSPSLPETKEGITEELRKQESLLGQLHSEMHAGICSKNREEQLWEVQRIITQLKRRLRGLERAAESTQRSIEEPDCGREEELNLSLQHQSQPQPQSPTQLVVEAVVEKPNLAACSADSLEIQAEKSWLAKKEELALTFETEELTNLAKTLQVLVENEKAEVALLKSQIRALGGNPIYSGFTSDNAADNNASEGMISAFKETAILQNHKQALISSLLEERLACVDLRVQIKLAQAAKG
ncbi:ralA-binding protein 1-like isoform X2 [Homalodisca vitripennis]|uniref:ralA-binding protein 1-like isoform X2 n=1 Tax=Homalodisca vitripennis TaxID=197043 RepID=UPI001EECED29|nr:ralA-binding protein 1-like isoform X2 [Homalodisca vitripennis]